MMVGSVAAGSDTFPAKPLTIIVPSPPGMGIDVITRVIADRLGRALGQQVIVDDRPGAGGVVAATAMLNAPADGYTLIAMATPMTIQMVLPGKPAYDLNRDFAHIAYLGVTPQVLVTGSRSSFHTFQDYLTKAKVEDMNVGAASVLSASHLAMEQWRLQSGIKLNLVNYKGSGDAQIGLASGDIAVMFDSLAAVIAQVKGGRLRPLAVGTAERVGALPEVPTIAEMGYPGFTAASWIGYSANSRIPPQVADRLSVELRRIFADPEVRARLEALGFFAQEMSREQYAAYVRNELERWARLIKTANIKVQ